MIKGEAPRTVVGGKGFLQEVGTGLGVGMGMQGFRGDNTGRDLGVWRMTDSAASKTFSDTPRE